MLQNIRDNSQGWIAKTIIGVIIVLLSLTGFDAIIRATDHSNVAAKVNGDDISLNEVQQAVDMQRRQLLQRLGKDFDPSMLDDKLLKEAALKGLIERTLLLQAAKDDKFAFSDQALDQLILQTPEFQVDGKFNADRFDQVIRQMNYSRMQFRQMLGQEMLIGQLRAGLAGTGFVTDNELQSFARLEKQTRDFATLAIKADASKSSVSEDEVKAFYEGHKSEFMTPEQVVVEYVELKKSSFFDQVKVKQEDLEALYQKEIANLSEQRDAAHILIEVNDKVGDEQAKAKIDEIKARLAKGEDFAALAKEFSQDIGSAATGGDLGYAGRGVYDPAFEEALYALKQGEVSAPVKTPYGYHLIKLLGAGAGSTEPGKPQAEARGRTEETDGRAALRRGYQGLGKLRLRSRRPEPAGAGNGPEGPDQPAVRTFGATASLPTARSCRPRSAPRCWKKRPTVAPSSWIRTPWWCCGSRNTTSRRSNRWSRSRRTSASAWPPKRPPRRRRSVARP